MFFFGRPGGMRNLSRRKSGGSLIARLFFQLKKLKKRAKPFASLARKSD